MQPLNEQQNEEVKAANKSNVSPRTNNPLNNPNKPSSDQVKPLAVSSTPPNSKIETLGTQAKTPDLKPTTGENPENATNDKVIEAQKHLSESKAHALSFAGKVGMNPYIYIRNKIEPLEQQLNAGIRTATLMGKIMELDKKFEPKA